MTPRTSVRAAARERYGELKKRAGASDSATPTPDPSPQGGGEQGAAPVAEDLIARIRALYEDTSVPVREIAGLAGVSERTLYKYVEKRGWKKRYAVMPRGLAAAAANRGRRWAHRQGLAPAKGAGGRFIRREDIGKPFATGLKALDARGRAQALARCGEAEPLAWEAQADAERRRRDDTCARAWNAVNRAMDKLIAYREERKRARVYEAQRRAAQNSPLWRKSPAKPREPFIDSDELEDGYMLAFQGAVDWLTAAQAERRRWNEGRQALDRAENEKAGQEAARIPDAH